MSSFSNTVMLLAVLALLSLTFSPSFAQPPPSSPLHRLRGKIGAPRPIHTPTNDSPSTTQPLDETTTPLDLFTDAEDTTTSEPNGLVASELSPLRLASEQASYKGQVASIMP